MGVQSSIRQSKAPMGGAEIGAHQRFVIVREEPPTRGTDTMAAFGI